MQYSIVYVGMDVHKDSFSLCCYTNEKEKAEYSQRVLGHYSKVINYLEAMRFHYGKDTVIEAMGTINGVMTTKVTASKWTHWGELAGIDYGNKASPAVIPNTHEGSLESYGMLASDAVWRWRLFSF